MPLIDSKISPTAAVLSASHAVICSADGSSAPIDFKTSFIALTDAGNNASLCVLMLSCTALLLDNFEAASSSSEILPAFLAISNEILLPSRVCGTMYVCKPFVVVAFDTIVNVVTEGLVAGVVEIQHRKDHGVRFDEQVRAWLDLHLA